MQRIMDYSIGRNSLTYSSLEQQSNTINSTIYSPFISSTINGKESLTGYGNYEDVKPNSNFVNTFTAHQSESNYGDYHHDVHSTGNQTINNGQTAVSTGAQQFLPNMNYFRSHLNEAYQYDLFAGYSDAVTSDDHFDYRSINHNFNPAFAESSLTQFNESKTVLWDQSSFLRDDSPRPLAINDEQSMDDDCDEEDDDDQNSVDSKPNFEIDLRSQNSDQPKVYKCGVCQEPASGKHYNGITCEGCKGFFRRTVTGKAQFQCKTGRFNCSINISNRRKCCRGCRFRQCIKIGMKPELCLKRKTMGKFYVKSLEMMKSHKITDLLVNLKSSYENNVNTVMGTYGSLRMLTGPYNEASLIKASYFHFIIELRTALIDIISAVSFFRTIIFEDQEIAIADVTDKMAVLLICENFDPKTVSLLWPSGQSFTMNQITQSILAPVGEQLFTICETLKQFKITGMMWPFVFAYMFSTNSRIQDNPQPPYDLFVAAFKQHCAEENVDSASWLDKIKHVVIFTNSFMEDFLKCIET